MLPKPPVPISLHRTLSAQAARIDAVLPQTQCQRCGYASCADYAEAIADGQADINQCPPGGVPGIEQLSRCTGMATKALNPKHGDITALTLAYIDPNTCIGCTLCLQACPVDAILGAHKRMHTVLQAECSGCELCLAVCPVDCISLITPQDEWSAIPAATSQRWRTAHQQHLQRYWNTAESSPSSVGSTHDFVQQALARAQARIGQQGS
ncbi:MAG: hypothetical protein RLZZ502_1160 [Pseudomonadota bacterium]|jgi:electron transport complex protein RnfB